MEKEPKAVAVAPEKKKVLKKRPLVFRGEEYDLNALTEEQREYLKGFPDEVPFLK
jgi:hypothetical protein